MAESEKMQIRVILKSGVDFVIECDKFILNKNLMDMPTGYKIEGITRNKPLYLNFDEIAAILRVYEKNF